MYRVLTPKFEKTGDVTRIPGKDDIEWCRAEMIELGIAKNLADALRKFPRCRKYGYSPILEPIKVH